jgi:hypothetical protein
MALAYGVRGLSSSGNLSLCVCLAFDRLLEFLFIRFFSFSFNQFTICVCYQCAHQGEIEDHVWFEDGGWSLPGVMTD